MTSPDLTMPRSGQANRICGRAEPGSGLEAPVVGSRSIASALRHRLRTASGLRRKTSRQVMRRVPRVRTHIPFQRHFRNGRNDGRLPEALETSRRSPDLCFEHAVHGRDHP